MRITPAFLAAGWVLASLAACQMPKQTISGSADKVVPATEAERFVDEPTRRVVKLTNGFTLILQQNKTAPVVAARIYVKAGSLTEQQHMGAGISHVCEHLVAGATSGKRGEDENTLLLQQIGNDSNAYTDDDQTCYFITTTAQKWPVALDLLVDWTTHANFTRQQFEREFKVVQREIEMDEAEADRIFYTHTLDTRYFVHPVRHPVVGYKSAFQKITFEDCKAYYNQMYVPDNMIVSVAGDIDLDKAEAMIIEQLKDVRRKTVPAIALPPEPAPLLPRRSVAHADVRQARVEWAFPTIALHSPDLYATDTLAIVLGGGESSILVKKLRDDLGLVTSISCSDDTPSYATGDLMIDAVLDPAKIPAAEQAVLQTLASIVNDGIPADALERAKAQAAAQRVFANQTAEQQASNNATDFMTTDSIDFSATYVQHIGQVTRDQVQAMARKYLRPEYLITTAVLPTGAPDPYAAAPATQRAAIAQVTVRKTVLKNGLTVLISRNPSAPVAAFDLYTLGGLLAETDANNGIGNAMMDFMTRSTDSKTHEQIADFLDATGTMLADESGSNSFHLSMQALKDKAPDAFALFADVALHPQFSADQLNKIRDPLLAEVKEATEDWSGEAIAAVRDAYYADSPYKRLPVGKASIVSALTPEAIRAHYQNYFLDPQKMVFAISGDIDPAAAERWAAQFESIPQKTVSLNLASTASSPRTVMRHTDKQSASVMLAYPPGITITDPDRDALIVLGSYLGGYNSESGSLLFDILRGKGLVYTVSAQPVMGPARGMFLIMALGEPQNATAIVSTIESLVEQTKKGQIPDAKFQAAKDQAITGELLAHQTIAERASSQALDELLGLGYDRDARFPQRIGAVTREQMIQAANKYLGAPVVVIVSPDAR